MLSFIVVFLGLVLFIPMGSNAALASSETTLQQLKQLETVSGGRLGVAVRDQQGEIIVAYRANERFPLCSTFKAVLSAAVLKKSTDSGWTLDERLFFAKEDLVSWSPKSQDHLEQGMTIRELCVATMQYSDNTAANLLMKRIGGPEAVTAFARSLGDTTFSLERWEPDLNSAIPGDERDTTSPEAMALTLYKIAVGSALQPSSKEIFVDWMKGNTTGDKAIRAGIPQGWVCADKTGSGSFGTSNDIAVIWLPSGKVYTVAIYFTQFEEDAQSRQDVVAQAAQILSMLLKEE